MTRVQRLIVAVMAAGLWCVGLGGRAGAGVTVLPGGSTVAGRTVGQYTGDWWNWAASIPGGPFADTTGGKATLNQSGPVFFVAGTSGGTSVSRSFQVPSDKYLLFPLLNLVVTPPPDDGYANPSEEVAAFATQAIDPSKLVAEIDGQPVPNLASHREASPEFTLTAAQGGVFPAGTYPGAVSDGYWLMVGPLGSGTHTLHFGGASDDFLAKDGSGVLLPSFTVDVTDRVTAGPSSVPLPPAVWPAVVVLAVAASATLRGRRRATS